MSDNARVKYGMPLQRATLDMRRLEEMQAERLRALGWTVYPPCSAVPALVEAVLEFRRANQELVNERDRACQGAYEAAVKDYQEATVAVLRAARKVAGEGER